MPQGESTVEVAIRFDSLQAVKQMQAGLSAVAIFGYLRLLLRPTYSPRALCLAVGAAVLVHTIAAQPYNFHLHFIATATALFPLMASALLIAQPLLSKTLRNSRQAWLGQKEGLLLCLGSLYLVALAGTYLLSPPTWQLLGQSLVYQCVGLILAGLLLIAAVDLVLLRPLRAGEVVRRKLFHLGPLLTIPYLHSISPDLLLIILSAAHLVFLLLQTIRYSLLVLRPTSGNPVVLRLMELFEWMASFNTRQKAFWFTHLFLIQALAIGYALDRSRAFPGQIALALITADAMAALVGFHFGKHKVYGNKTIEGTLAFALTLLAAETAVCPQRSWLHRVAAAGLCSLAELVGGDADNLLTLLVYALFHSVFLGDSWALA